MGFSSIRGCAGSQLPTSVTNEATRAQDRHYAARPAACGPLCEAQAERGTPIASSVTGAKIARPVNEPGTEQSPTPAFPKSTWDPTSHQKGMSWRLAVLAARQQPDELESHLLGRLR